MYLSNNHKNQLRNHWFAIEGTIKANHATSGCTNGYIQFYSSHKAPGLDT